MFSLNSRLFFIALLFYFNFLTFLSKSASEYNSKILDDLFAANVRGHNRQIKSILDLHPEFINLPDHTPKKWTPLHHAVFWYSEDLVQYLLENKADPNRESGAPKTTPLHIAISRYKIINNIEKIDLSNIVKLLIDAGANIEAESSVGTALDITLNNKCPEAIEQIQKALERLNKIREAASEQLELFPEVIVDLIKSYIS